MAGALDGIAQTFRTHVGFATNTQFMYQQTVAAGAALNGVYQRVQLGLGTLLAGGTATAVTFSRPAMAAEEPPAKESPMVTVEGNVEATTAIAAVAPMLILTKLVTAGAVSYSTSGFKIPDIDTLRGIDPAVLKAPLPAFKIVLDTLQHLGGEFSRLRRAGKTDAKIATQERTMGTVVPHIVAGIAALVVYWGSRRTVSPEAVAVATGLTALFAERTSRKLDDDHWIYRFARPLVPTLGGLGTGLATKSSGWGIVVGATLAAFLDAFGNRPAGTDAKTKNKARLEGAIYEQHWMKARDLVIAYVEGTGKFEKYGRFSPPVADKRDGDFVSTERWKRWFVGELAAMNRDQPVEPMSADSFAQKISALEKAPQGTTNEPKRFQILLLGLADLDRTLNDELRAGGFTLQPKEVTIEHLKKKATALRDRANDLQKSEPSLWGKLWSKVSGVPHQVKIDRANREAKAAETAFEKARARLDKAQEG